MIGYTVTLPNEKNAHSRDTITQPVKNCFENWYAVPYRLKIYVSMTIHVALTIREFSAYLNGHMMNKARNKKIVTPRAMYAALRNLSGS